MSKELPILTITPIMDSRARDKARKLAAIGFYEEVAIDRWRLTEEGVQWIVQWMPDVIAALIDYRRNEGAKVEQ